MALSIRNRGYKSPNIQFSGSVRGWSRIRGDVSNRMRSKTVVIGSSGREKLVGTSLEVRRTPTEIGKQLLFSVGGHLRSFRGSAVR